MPDEFLARYGWDSTWRRTRSTKLRGDIRLAEECEELKRLGLHSQAIVLLRNQSWNAIEHTPPEAFNSDGSLKDVRLYEPGPIEPLAIADVRQSIASAASGLTILAVPEPDDEQVMHRMTTAVVLSALAEITIETGECPVSLLTYSCLSTRSRAPETESVHLYFDEEIMAQKCFAISAHESMTERRRLFGGYSNQGHEAYEVLVREWNRASCCRLESLDSYAEDYGWVERPPLNLLENLRSCALAGA